MSRTRLLPAALCVLGALALPPAAGAAPGMEIAVQDDHALVTQSYPNANRGETLDLARQFQAKWVRANVMWAAANGTQARSRTKPATPTYDFGSLDALVLAARERGMQVELTLTGNAPAWATGNKKVGPYKPNAKYFGEFARAVVTHFGGNVNRYTIWNEPNLDAWLTPVKSSPGLYRSLYKTAYKAIKAANPAAQVLIGETSPYGTRTRKGQLRSWAPVAFLRKVVAGQKLVADGYAHHPYDFQHAPDKKWPGKDNATLATLGNLTKELTKQALAGTLRTPVGGALDVFLTEYGYLRQGRFKLSESKRAKYLKQAYDIALATPRVRQMLQYLMIEPAKRYAFFDMSLANRNGTPYGAAFKALVNWAKANQGQINGAGV